MMVDLDVKYILYGFVDKCYGRKDFNIIMLPAFEALQALLLSPQLKTSLWHNDYSQLEVIMYKFRTHAPSLD